MLVVVNSLLQVSQKLAVQPGETTLPLSADDRDHLVRWAHASTTRSRVVTRSLIVLLAACGWSNARIATAMGISRRTVALWKARFAEQGRHALLVDAPGRGRKHGRDHQIVSRIVMMSSEPPPHGSRWTVRSLARVVGASHATVQRVWREHQIKPVVQAEKSI